MKQLFRSISFTLESRSREILETEKLKTGKNRSEIIRELIASLDTKNKEAA